MHAPSDVTGESGPAPDDVVQREEVILKDDEDCKVFQVRLETSLHVLLTLYYTPTRDTMSSYNAPSLVCEIRLDVNVLHSSEGLSVVLEFGCSSPHAVHDVLYS